MTGDFRMDLVGHQEDERGEELDQEGGRNRLYVKDPSLEIRGMRRRCLLTQAQSALRDLSR